MNLTNYKVKTLSGLSQSVTITASFNEETIKEDNLIKASAILELLQEKIIRQDKYIANQNDTILNLSALHTLSNQPTWNINANEISSKFSNEHVCHDK